jgi:hypothetical protein
VRACPEPRSEVRHPDTIIGIQYYGYATLWQTFDVSLNADGLLWSVEFGRSGSIFQRLNLVDGR